MFVSLESVASQSHPCFDDLLKLYAASFPIEERRNPCDLAGFLGEKEMHFSAVCISAGLAGLVIWWDFSSFIYVEHLAVVEDLRGQGVGGAVLNLLSGKGIPVLAEVEIPFDEASFRRISFYNRAGFTALPVDYFQPPYRIGEEVLPMQLFSNQADWQPGLLRQSIRLFHTRVYKFHHS